MILFIQELVLLLFLWMLRMIDGMIEIFSVIAGVTDVSYQGGKINLIGYIVGDSTVGTIFWCVFILAVGLTCIFAIVGIIKNMLANNRNLSSIGGKFFLALLGTLAMLAVVILGILIANSLLVLVSKIFQVQNTTKLSNAIFNACAGQCYRGASMYFTDKKSKREKMSWSGVDFLKFQESQNSINQPYDEAYISVFNFGNETYYIEHNETITCDEAGSILGFVAGGLAKMGIEI